MFRRLFPFVFVGAAMLFARGGGFAAEREEARVVEGDLLETPAPVPVVDEKGCHEKCPNCCLSCGEDCYWVCVDKDCKKKKRVCFPQCNKCGSKYECGMDTKP